MKVCLCRQSPTQATTYVSDNYGTFEVGDEHAELRAPVSDVVEPEDVVAEEVDEVGDGVSDDGGAQVAHVHLLRDVGRGVVDDGPLPVIQGIRMSFKLNVSP